MSKTDENLSPKKEKPHEFKDPLLIGYRLLFLKEMEKLAKEVNSIEELEEKLEELKKSALEVIKEFL